MESSIKTPSVAGTFSLRAFLGRSLCLALALLFPVCPALARQSEGALRVLVTDQSGGRVVGAAVVLTGAGGLERRARTDHEGVAFFGGLAPGGYALDVKADGFAAYRNAELSVKAGRREQLDVKLYVALAEEKVTIRAGASPGLEARNGLTTIVLGAEDIEKLPVGAGGLVAALQALAVPSIGMNGGQILVDGFTSGRFPPKEAIQEVRINQNPFSAEYWQLGYGRIEVITKPGAETFRGGAVFSFNDESLNSRNPFADRRAPFQSRLYGVHLGGPVVRGRSSYFLDFERYETDDNANVNANVLDSNLNVVPLQLSLLTPQRRMTFGGRFDQQLSERHTLVARYARTSFDTRNADVGRFSLPSRAARSSRVEHLLQLTETAVLSQRALNELRFSYVREQGAHRGESDEPGVNVLGAFFGGGSGAGLSSSRRDRWELQNYTTWAAGRFVFKAGGQLRGIGLTDSSSENFNGTFVFAGGLAPQLDADNRILLDAEGRPVYQHVTSIERYRRTLLFMRQGLSPAEVRERGGGASQFTIAGGSPAASVGQYEVGAFLQADWRARSNFMLNLGLRYETQNNISSRLNFAPRAAFAWSPHKTTVVRGGVGIFYERFGEHFTLRAERFGDAGWRQFVVTDPALLELFPRAPSPDALDAFVAQQTTTRVAPDLRAPYTIQSSLSVERQISPSLTLAATYLNARTLHALRSRNVNAPLPAASISNSTDSLARPFPQFGEIFQYESSGIFKQHQLSLNAVTRFGKRVTFYVTYVVGKAESDTDGADTFPGDSFDAEGEFGRSVLDVRHNFYLGGWLSAPLGLDFHTLVFMRSGVPFNITTGRDANLDALYAERPAFATDTGRPSVVRTPFGAFDTEPLPGQQIVPRNYGTGPSFYSVNLGVSRTFNFALGAGAKAAERKYSMTLSLLAENLLNRTNGGTPVGNLSSPLFGRPHSSAGPFGLGENSGGNRRLTAQISLAF